jgi:trigger factor
MLVETPRGVRVKVETAELPDSEVALSLEIDDARLQRAMDGAYRRAAGRVNIAGFRRGKAPRALVERVVGREALLEEALGQVLPEAFSDAVEETQIRPVMEPEFDVESLSPLRAKATVVVEPSVTLGDYRGIRKELKAAEVDDASVDSAIDALRERHAQWVPVERAAQAGDLVTLTATGTAGGRQVFRREEVEYFLDAESNAPLPGFVEQIVGMAGGDDREFEIPVPSDEEWGSLAGQSVAFRASILDVTEKELPDLDDAFAEALGYEGVGALRNRIEADLRENADVAARRATQQEVLDETVLFCMVKVPQKLVDQQAARAYERLVGDLDSRGLAIEQYVQALSTTDDALRTELASDAERSLKRRFVLQRIAAEEGLQVTEEEVEGQIRVLLEVSTATNRAAPQSFQLPKARQSVRASLLESKAVEWLFSNATGGEPSAATTPSDTDGEQQP